MRVFKNPSPRTLRVLPLAHVNGARGDVPPSPTQAWEKGVRGMRGFISFFNTLIECPYTVNLLSCTGSDQSSVRNSASSALTCSGSSCCTQ